MIHLYQKIAEDLRCRVDRGEFPRGSRIPSTRDLASEYETSSVTIDKALAVLVDEHVIVRKPKQGSFVCDGTIQPKGRSSKLIGAIVFDASVSHYWYRVVTGMEEAILEEGYHLVLGHSEHSFDKAIRYIEDLSEKGIDGFIYVPIDMPTEEEYERENLRVVRRLEETGKPFILFDRWLAARRDSLVSIDSYEPTAALTEHLFDVGCTNPMAVSLYYASVIGERERAFKDVLRRHGFQDPESRILRLNGYRFTPADYPAVRRALGEFGVFDGLFSINSGIANALITIDTSDSPGELLGKVPIVAFKEIEVFHPERMQLVAHQPIHELGVAAGELIVREARYLETSALRRVTEQIYLPCIVDSPQVEVHHADSAALFHRVR